MAYYCTKIRVPYRRTTYSLSQCWISEYIEHSEHLSNNGTIAERVANGSEPSGQLEHTEIFDKLPTRHSYHCVHVSDYVHVHFELTYIAKNRDSNFIS